MDEADVVAAALLVDGDVVPDQESDPDPAQEESGWDTGRSGGCGVMYCNMGTQHFCNQTRRWDAL